VRGHAVAKRRDLRRKCLAGLGDQSIAPARQHGLCRVEEPLRLGRLETAGQLHRRQPGRVQDLIRVRVANSAEQGRIRERSLQRVILASKTRVERREAEPEDLDAARIERRHRVGARHDMERRAFLGASFGEQQRRGR